MATDHISSLSITQASGDVYADLSNARRFISHQIHVAPSSTPSAGTLVVSVKTPGAETYVQVGEIDLTDHTEYITRVDGCNCDSMRFKTTSLDASVTVAVTVYSCDG